MEVQLRYEIDQASEATVGEIVKLAREVWRELYDEGSLAREEAARAGIPVDALPRSMEEVLSVNPSGAGFEPGSVALVITGMLLNGTSRAALDLWKYVVLPRIRAKWGDQALKLLVSPRKAAPARAERASARTAARGARQKKGRKSQSHE